MLSDRDDFSASIISYLVMHKLRGAHAAGANPAALDSDRFSPLMRAAAAGQHVAMEPLLTSAVNVFARDAVYGRSVVQ